MSSTHCSGRPFRFAHFLLLLTIAATASLIATAQPVPVSPDVARAELAPNGKLRVGINSNNSMFVTKDSTSGEVRGLAIDLGRELAARLGVPFEPVLFPVFALFVQGARLDLYDIALVGTTQPLFDYTTPYMDVDLTCIVAPEASIRTVVDADRAGIRIAVSEEASADLILSRMIKNATLVRLQGIEAAFAALRSGDADVVAALRPVLLDHVDLVPGSRILDDRFAVIHVAIGVPKGRRAGLAYADGFIKNAIASGMVRKSVERAGLRGVTVPVP